MEKMEGSIIFSNGILGVLFNVFEVRGLEGKKLDERIIFDVLKLSSDVQKLVFVLFRCWLNVERKDNVNRRSWKFFMLFNFLEFVERMEVFFSEVLEVGVLNFFL